MMKDILRMLVFEHKVIDYRYFMDEMQFYELEMLMEMTPYANKISYEQMRYIMWASLAPHFDKAHKNTTPEQIFPFKTDKKQDEGDGIKFTEEDVANIRNSFIQKNQKLKNGE